MEEGFTDAGTVSVRPFLFIKDVKYGDGINKAKL
jgi:hypothetical protein